ncbi:RNA polymerase sigma-70 factor [filamentous cyanobacterium LEGE 11480]|uniref:RNA polymerase sigma-70 factor n=1 Tax=Romeriopsis navalis LEGE 11480 TaxID=2777977 RepID=A0A928Z3L3_9CYAN|nr:RNA polymerase sigma-70 factor [Romeriopsis navalis]MBE9029343.1 RNA polymerase sigma-70 factor [Romeriopsis navalis LEGE 11480]
MNRVAIFKQYRSLLFAIAYRMLGQVSDAEDIVQEAWIRWQGTQTVVESPKSFLAALTTRLCIDYLRSARVRREQYVGTWLPEPLLTQHPPPLDQSELAESLSFAFLTLLECLSPTARAVFLLRAVFDYDYDEIGQIVDKTPPNCRQIFRRAQQQLQQSHAHPQPLPSTQENLVRRFLQSWQTGDIDQMLTLLAPDVTTMSDSNGIGTALRYPISGQRRVAQFWLAVRRSRLIPAFQTQLMWLNQQPGIVTYIQHHPQSAMSFDFAGEQIQTIYTVLNPDKLSTIAPRLI